MRTVTYYASLMLLVALFLQGQAKTYRVGNKLPLKSIQKTIHDASNGDTVLVESGIYYEKNLIIDKSIDLIGINRPVLDGEGKYEVVSIKANHCSIQGFKIQHSGYATLTDPAGIKIYDASHVTIFNNILDDTFFGIFAQYAKKCLIKNNHLVSYGKEEQRIGDGIHCWKSDSINIIGNTITGHRDGIYFEFVSNSIILNNKSVNNLRYGLHFMFSHDDSYYVNTFSGNGAGVAVMFSHGVKMYYNNFEDNWGDGSYGLLLKEITDSYIEGNKFKKNTVGIFMDGASRLMLKRNTFNSNGWALKLFSNCVDVTVYQNNFLGNTFDIGTNGTLMLNNFNGNYWDKYEGYDLDRNKIGDVPYRPISMFSVIIEKNPPAMILFRSIMVSLLDKSEKLIPSLTPENFKDETPYMKPLKL